MSISSGLKAKFIIFSILAVLLLTLLPLILPSIMGEPKAITSMQLELNSIKECVQADTLASRKSVKALEQLEVQIAGATADKASKAKIIESISGLKKEMSSSRSKTIFQLLDKLEAKANLLNLTQKNSTLEWVQTIFNWPIVVIYLIIALAYFNFSISTIRELFGKVQLKSVSILGNEISFSDEVKQNTENAISLYRQNIKQIFGAQIQKEKLEDKLRSLVEDILKELRRKSKITNVQKKWLRCTIHIQDILFYETLYQLMDYYPKSANGGSGRIKSFRFGIIGLAWRMEKSQVRGNIAHTQDTLIRDWGLDISETTFDNKTRSFAAILLKGKDGTRLGVVYLDSEEENLFGDDTIAENITDALEFEAFVIKACEEKEITESLTNLRKNLSDKFLQLRIYE